MQIKKTDYQIEEKKQNEKLVKNELAKKDDLCHLTQLIHHLQITALFNSFFIDSKSILAHGMSIPNAVFNLDFSMFNYYDTIAFQKIPWLLGFSPLTIVIVGFMFITIVTIVILKQFEKLCKWIQENEQRLNKPENQNESIQIKRKLRIYFILCYVMIVPIIKNSITLFSCNYQDLGSQCIKFTITQTDSYLNIVQLVLMVVFLKDFNKTFNLYRLYGSMEIYPYDFKTKQLKYHSPDCPVPCKYSCVRLYKPGLSYQIELTRPQNERAKIYPDKDLDTYIFRTNNNILPFAMWYQGYSYEGKQVAGEFFQNMMLMPILVCLNNLVMGKQRIFSNFIIVCYYQLKLTLTFSNPVKKNYVYQSDSVMAKNLQILSLGCTGCCQTYLFLKYVMNSEISILYFVGICVYLFGIVIGINYLILPKEIYYPDLDIYDVFQEKLDSNTNDQDQEDKNLIIQFSPQKWDWNLYDEALQRIWLPFWDKLIKNDDEYKKQPDIRILTYTDNTKEEIILSNVQQRIKKMKDILDKLKLTKDQIIDGLSQKNQEQLDIIIYVQQYLVGPDVFWDGKVQGKQNTKSFFGKCWIEPFPLALNLQYEEDDQSCCQIMLSEWSKFVEINRSDEIVEKRQIRQQIRALAGQKIQFKVSTIFAREDGLKEVYQYGEGLCLLNGKQKNDSQDHRFQFQISFKYAQSRDTQVKKFYKERDYTIQNYEIGITSSYTLIDRLRKLLNENQTQIAKNRIKIIEEDNKFRQKSMFLNNQENQVISWAFFCMVFMNIGITLPNLIEFMKNDTSMINNVITRHLMGLKYVYNILMFYQTSAVNAYWYLTFDDIWYYNHASIPEIAENYLILNSEYPSFLGYHVLTKNDLQMVLKAARLDKLLTRKFIKQFYKTINMIGKTQDSYNLQQNIFKMKQTYSLPRVYLKQFDKNYFNPKLLIDDLTFIPHKKVSIFNVLTSDQYINMSFEDVEKQLDQNLLQLDNVLRIIQKDLFQQTKKQVLQYEVDKSPIIIKLPDHFYPNLNNQQAQLPVGWKYKLDFRGKIYYVNDNMQKTTLIHPKRGKFVSDEIEQDFIQNGALPEGWEIMFTKQGNKVYLNHKQRLTQYNDPRKEKKKVKK